jgi:hypothetical protein
LRGFELYLTLPCQISPEYQDIFDEEISQAEVEDAINEAHEISTRGLSRQTIALFKLLFFKKFLESLQPL